VGTGSRSLARLRVRVRLRVRARVRVRARLRDRVWARQPIDAFLCGEGWG
jgi:hypothetical protein